MKVNDGATFNVLDPATGKAIARVPDAGAAEARAAVDAAEAAFADWAEVEPRGRAEILRDGYEALTSNIEDLASLITAENGKLIDDARAEVAYAADFFRWYAEEAVRTEGSYGRPPSGQTRALTTHRPVGVAALVTPWNFPAAMVTRKLAPALAAGCTTVLNPATETPLTAVEIARHLTEAGLPPGVVNVVPTSSPAEVVTAWLEDPRVRKVSFTGSTAVGKVLLRQAAERVLNASMELGGNAPFIVTADADVAAAVNGAMVAKFRNAGQACTAANRFLVHSDVASQFVKLLRKEMMPMPMAPLISPVAVARVEGLVEQATRAGAQVAYRGTVPDRGSYYPATLLVNVTSDMNIAGEEVFGPVAAVQTWDDEASMIRQANQSEHGLAAYVYAGRLQDALRIAESLEAGMVGVNTGAVSDPAAPFGGMKESGLGREGARHGIREYQEVQYFNVSL